MKKFKLSLVILFGIFVDQPSLYAAPVSMSIIEPTTNEWQNHFKLCDLAKWDTKDFQKITGKKLNFLEKIAFKISQNKMKRYLKKHNDISIAEYIKTEETEKKKFSFLWFMIGLLGPVIGVLTVSYIGLIFFVVAPIALVYLLKRSKTEKGSLWTGLGISVLILLALAVIAANAL